MSDDFEKDLAASLKRARQSFEGAYGSELAELRARSAGELGIRPHTSDAEVYAALLATVEAASRNNVQTAQLKQSIESLGLVAVGIASRVSGLARLFV